MMFLQLVPGLLVATSAGAGSLPAGAVVLEGEELAAPDDWQVVDSGYLQGVRCSGGLMLRCASGVAAAAVTIPRSGEYSVWARSHGEEARSLCVSVGDNELAQAFGRDAAYWDRGGLVQLPAGDVNVSVHDCVGGPYLDVVLLVPSGDFVPRDRFLPNVIRPRRGDPIGVPRCIRKVDLRNFGAWSVRYGYLDDDDEVDAVFVQSRGQQVTCVTAVSMSGEVLWQLGEPDATRFAIGSDVAAQVYDWDADGQAEVLYIDGLTLNVCDGSTGHVEQQARVPGNDCILITNMAGADRPGDMVVKDRYEHAWGLDRDLNVMWHYGGRTGHYPCPGDVDGDGRDEIMCGYALLDDDGAVLWERSDLPDHNDAVDIDDMDGDGTAEIAVACSRDGALFARDGTPIFRKALQHCQHAIIGQFVPDARGREAVFVDRGQGGRVLCCGMDGTEYWLTAPHGWLTIASTIDGWTDGPKSRVLLYRREDAPACLLDREGRIATEFPFPPAPRSGYRQYFAQHFDAYGDAREEVFINNEAAIWVYTNAEGLTGPPPPKRTELGPRIYNATFYVGWQ